jgi:hypothetical protein
MMPQITVSPSLYNKLKTLADPFVDTPESVVHKCVDFYISKHTGTAPAARIEPDQESALVFPLDGPPDLTFTRPLSITLDDVKYEKKMLYWNTLLFDVVAKAAVVLKSPEKLRELILVNYAEGERGQEQGYRYIPEAGLSVQGQTANAAWNATSHIVKAVRMNIDVAFLWESKDKAAHPGKTGRMTYKPA